MADGVFNIAKGRVNEFVNRVNDNDPTGSELVLILLKTDDTDANLKDFDDVAAILAGAAVEADFASYARIDLTDTDLAGSVVDDGADTNDADITVDPVWSSATTGQALFRLIVAYDSTGAAADAALIPLTFHDFAITTNGNDLTAQIAAAGFFSAA